jgi:hypothetical protein
MLLVSNKKFYLKKPFYVNQLNILKYLPTLIDLGITYHKYRLRLKRSKTLR